MQVMLFRVAAAFCSLGVALGAFGAHALKETLAAREMLGAWEKAVMYQLIHAIALLVLSIIPDANRAPAMLLLSGIILFSGSLYVMALTNIRALGVVTPLGGLCFLAGWAWLLAAPTR